MRTDNYRSAAELLRSYGFRFIAALVYLNYCLMMNGAARGYVHRGTVPPEKAILCSLWCKL